MPGENNSQPSQDSDAIKKRLSLTKDKNHFTNNQYFLCLCISGQ